MYVGLRECTSDTDTHLGGNLDSGDPFSYAPSVWNYLIDRFCVKSVLDLGSGIGHASAYFHKRDLMVVAVDGLKSNVDTALYPTVCLDITESSVVTSVDLVHCQEFVEHIEEAFVENIINSFKCGQYVCMTHAFPGQGGYHHVNEQPTDYWISLLERNGFSLLIEDSNRVRALAKGDNARYLANSGLVFRNLSR